MFSNIIPEGFKDDVTSQVVIEHKFKNLMIDHFQLFGFGLVKTPLIEYFDPITDKNAFKILVQKNENKLVIRDDITLQVARLSQTRLSNKKRPLKLCYYGEVVRKKGTMLRPERQFLQIGAEYIGESSYFADIEMMDLAYSSLNLVGIKDITLEISSRVFFDRLITICKKSNRINEIKRLIKLKDLNSLLNILDQKDHKYTKDLFACTGIYKYKKKNLNKLKIDSSTSKEITNLKNIIETFSSLHKNVKIFLDLCEIDDKNYHSGIRFTFFAENIRGEIARGGRYNVKNSISDNEATGFTCYMDSILRASSTKLMQKKIMIPFNTDKFKIKDLINKGFIVTKNCNSLSITKKLARDQNCQFYFKNNSIIKL